MPKIENIRVDNMNDSGRHAALSWTVDDARFHAWFDPSDWTIKPSFRRGSPPTVFKNSIAKFGEPGYFKTRHLDASSGPTAKMLADAKAFAIANNLIAKAMQDLDAAKAAERHKIHADWMAHACKEAGPVMLAALQAIVMRTTPHIDDDLAELQRQMDHIRSLAESAITVATTNPNAKVPS